MGLFTIGLLAGGVATASALWLVSGLATPIPPSWRAIAVAVIAGAAVLRDIGLLRLKLPQNARQIPQEVFQRNLLTGSAQFGFELGTGVRTYVTSSAPYVVAFAILLTADGYIPALLTGLGFGAGRALTPLMRVGSGSPDQWDDRLERRLRAVTVSVCSTLAVVAIMRVALS